MIKALLSAGVDINLKDEANGNTAKQWAVAMQHKECERLLEEADSPDIDDSIIPLSKQTEELNKTFISPDSLKFRKAAIINQNKAFLKSKNNNFKPLLECFIK